MCHNDVIAVGNVVDPDLLIERFQMTMTISLFWEVQKFPINMAAKTMPCKLDIQSFQALAPLSKVDPFGHEEFSLITAE